MSEELNFELEQMPFFCNCLCCRNPHNKRGQFTSWRKGFELVSWNF